MPDIIRTQVTIGHKCPTYGCHGDRGLRRTKQVGFPNPTNTETPVSPTVSDRHETVCRYKQYQIRGRVYPKGHKCAIGTHAAVGYCHKNSNACVACATHPTRRLRLLKHEKPAMNLKKALFGLLFFAAASAQAAEPFTGLYRSGGVDSVSKLMLLDNQKFCFALSAGNLDMLTGGTWQVSGRNGDNIELQLTEQKLPLSDVVILANPEVGADTLADAEAQTGRRRILFLTPPALENALGDMNALIAFGRTAEAPETFKQIYDPAAGTSMYARIAIPEHARYIFVGSRVTNKLYRFNIGNSRYAKLNPNPQAGRASLDGQLTFNLSTGELEQYGQPEKVAPANQQAAWQQCEPKAEAVTSVRGNARTLLNAETVQALQPHLRPRQNLAP